MSTLFPALKAMGEGCGAKLFYLTARNTTQAAAEDALARLRAAQPGLALRSVTLTAKEKACLHPDAEGRPACLPELCPYANGYYDRRWASSMRNSQSAAAAFAAPHWRIPPGSSRSALLNWGWT